MQKNIEQLHNSIQSVKNFKTSIYVEVDGFIQMAQLTSDEHCKFIRSYLFASPGCLMSKHCGHDTIAAGFTELANLLPGAKLFLESVTVDSEKPDLIGLSRSAWCEALGWSVNQTPELINPEEACQVILRDNLWSKLKGGATGVQQWNKVEYSGRRLINWSDSKLDGAKLKGVDLSRLDFANSCFDRAELENASLGGSIISNATFCGAALMKANLASANAKGANFTGARLRYLIDLIHAISK